MVVIYLLIFILGLYSVFFVKQFINIIFGYAPLISTKKKILNQILDNINIKNDFIIYELGCGKADFLKLVESKKIKADLIGIENLFIANLVLKLQLRLMHSKIKIIQNDFFKENLSKADIIYCFLNNNTMKKLGEKFLRECKKETVIVSHKFPIVGFLPVKVLGEYGDKVYFYKI